MKYLELFLATLFFSISQNYLTFENTKWIYNYGEGYESHYIFKATKYEFYDAETGETIFGTYIVKNDTIYINQLFGIYDEEFHENSRHRTQKKCFKFVLKNNDEIGFVENWDNNNKIWINNFYFKKVN